LNHGTIFLIDVKQPRTKERGASSGAAYLKTQQEVLAILDEALSLRGRASEFDRNTPLLGALPELDSMGVVNVITMIEERFGFVVDADELDGHTFETVGTLVKFVDGKMQ
jgi:acyl carrier protein